MDIDNQYREQVRRIENMELELTVWNAGRSLSAARKQLEIRRLGSCTLLRERTGPDSPYYNRVKGFGAEELSLLPAILDYYEEIGALPCFDMIPERVSEAVAYALTEKGYAPSEELVFMAADASDRPDDRSPYDIGKVDAGNAEQFIGWIGLTQESLKIDNALMALKKAYFYDPGFQNYTIESGGRPAAMGSLFIRGDEGYVANDFTFESFRGRGCQSALLRHRIREAYKQGVKRVYTDVEPETASFRNMVRAGFTVVFHSVYWTKERE